MPAPPPVFRDAIAQKHALLQHVLSCVSEVEARQPRARAVLYHILNRAGVGVYLLTDAPKCEQWTRVGESSYVRRIRVDELPVAIQRCAHCRLGVGVESDEVFQQALDLTALLGRRVEARIAQRSQCI